MSPSSWHARSAAFTLVELVVVVLILGILAGVAAPKLFAAAETSEASTILTNVKTIFDAAERYAARHGEWPENSANGQFSEDFRGYLPESLFLNPTHAGDPYDWNGPGTGLAFYGVSIYLSSQPSDVSITSALPVYQELERLADDDDSSNGWIQAKGNLILFKLADK